MRYYDGGMKVKTSITLSEALLNAMTQLPEQFQNRSCFLETAAWAYIAELNRATRAARDLEIINQHADVLNEEAQDALAYQVGL